MQLIDGVCQKHCPLVFLAGLLLVKEYATYVKFHTGCAILFSGLKEADKPLNDNNYIYIFRNIKTPNYIFFCMSFFFCVHVSFINNECLYC